MAYMPTKINTNAFMILNWLRSRDFSRDIHTLVPTDGVELHLSIHNMKIS